MRLAPVPGRCDDADMKHVTIRLSDAQGTLIEERTVTGEFASIDAYVASLVDAGDDDRARERWEALLLEGLEGEGIEMTDAHWDRLHRIATGQEGRPA